MCFLWEEQSQSFSTKKTSACNLYFTINPLTESPSRIHMIVFPSFQALIILQKENHLVIFRLLLIKSVSGNAGAIIFRSLDANKAWVECSREINFLNLSIPVINQRLEDLSCIFQEAVESPAFLLLPSSHPHATKHVFSSLFNIRLHRSLKTVGAANLCS